VTGFGDIAVRAVVIGVGATILLDLWNLFLERAFGIPSLKMSMLGRWFGHVVRGRLIHNNIAKAAAISGERTIGWCAHYAIGIVWAAVLLAIWGPAWAIHPTLWPAMIVGLVTLAAPFFLLQPGMGLGIASSKAPRPNINSLKSLASHTVYGLGLYASASLAARMF
jgi:hypothetical protein